VDTFQSLLSVPIMFLLIISFILALGIWPALVLYAVWRLLKDVRRIVIAQEHMAYAAPPRSGPPAPQPAVEPAPREQRIGLSAFGR
jgi:hypothetical protein